MQQITIHRLTFVARFFYAALVFCFVSQGLKKLLRDLLLYSSVLLQEFIGTCVVLLYLVC